MLKKVAPAPTEIFRHPKYEKGKTDFFENSELFNSSQITKLKLTTSYYKLEDRY